VGDEKEGAFKELKEKFTPLTKWWKDRLKERVAGVKLSNRLSTTPCVIVASKFGQTANMERIMRAQVRGARMVWGVGRVVCGSGAEVSSERWEAHACV